MRKIRILLASPEELKKEREIVSEEVDSLNRTLGKQLELQIELIKSETHSRPGIGDYPQQVINKQFGSYDIFIGLLWKRIGTQTPKAISGTIEEYQLALDSFNNKGYPKIMFYFKKTKFYPASIEDCNQFIEILRFRNNIPKLYYWSFTDKKEFRTRIHEHLFHEISEINELPLNKSDVIQIEAHQLLQYDGALLFREEYEFLKEMEGYIREIIPFYEETEEGGPPDSYFMLEKNHIISLNIEKMDLKFLPDSIANLTFLRFLWLGYNSLKTLPETIGKIKSLHYIVINNNQIEYLPESIGQLSSLEELDLESNKLTELPETIGQLSSLRSLSLISNRSLNYSENAKKTIRQLENSGCQIKF